MQPVRAAQSGGPLRRFGPMTAPPGRAILCLLPPPRVMGSANVVCRWSLRLLSMGGATGCGWRVQQERASCMGVARACLCRCTPTPWRCTAWQGMGCERAGAIHKRAACKHASTIHTAPAWGPRERLLLAQLLIQLAGCSGCAHVHFKTGCWLAGCSSRQRRKIKCTGICAPAPSSGLPALLLLTVR